MKKRILLALVVAFFVALGLFGSFSQKSQTPSSPTPQTITSEASLIIDFGEETIETKTKLNEEQTVYDLLVSFAKEKGIEVETQQYDFGIFVKSINEVGGDKDMAWIYFVNGNAGDIASDQKEVQPGDTIEWKYTKPSY